MRRENDWPHAPLHRPAEAGTFFITAATYRKTRFLHDRNWLDVLQCGLLKLAMEFGWQLEAWPVFSESLLFRRSFRGGG